MYDDLVPILSLYKGKQYPQTSPTTHPSSPWPADMVTKIPPFFAPKCINERTLLRLDGEGGGGYKVYVFGKYLI